MKKNILIIVAAIFMAAYLSACGTGAEAAADNSGKLSIVTTIFPEYDWVMNILGDNPAGAEVTMLLDNGVDLPHAICSSMSEVNLTNGLRMH